MRVRLLSGLIGVCSICGCPGSPTGPGDAPGGEASTLDGSGGSGSIVPSGSGGVGANSVAAAGGSSNAPGGGPSGSPRDAGPAEGVRPSEQAHHLGQAFTIVNGIISADSNEYGMHG